MVGYPCDMNEKSGCGRLKLAKKGMRCSDCRKEYGATPEQEAWAAKPEYVCDMSKTSGCGVILDKKGMRCAGCRHTYGATPEQEAWTEKRNEYHTESMRKRRAGPTCTGAGCSSTDLVIKGYCADCRDIHQASSSASRDKRIAEGRCAACGKDRDVSSRHCNDCLVKNNAGQGPRQRKYYATETYAVTAAAYQAKVAELPMPKLSILAQLDLKHDFAVKKLKKLTIPDASERYAFADSEMVEIAASNDPYNIDEWSVMYYDENAKPVWYRWHAKSKKPTDSELEHWSGQLASIMHDRIMVQYGISIPETHRFNQLMAHLPDGASFDAADLRFIDVQQSIMERSGLFSRNPADELNPNAPVYIPVFALSTISLLMNQDQSGNKYIQSYTRMDQSDMRSTEGSFSWKSTWDVQKLADLCHVLCDKRDGKMFSSSYTAMPAYKPASGLFQSWGLTTTTTAVASSSKVTVEALAVDTAASIPSSVPAKRESDGAQPPAKKLKKLANASLDSFVTKSTLALAKQPQQAAGGDGKGKKKLVVQSLAAFGFSAVKRSDTDGGESDKENV